MLLRMLSLTLAVLLVTSCKKKELDHVRIYNEESVETLNGDVKQVVIAEPYSFATADFDEKGNIVNMTMRDTDISETNGVKSSSVSTAKATYTFLSDSKGNKSELVVSYSWHNTGSGTGSSTGKSKWLFDKNGHIDKYLPDADTSSYAIGTYTYDSDGDMIRYKRQFNAKREPDIYEYKYDSSHRVIAIGVYEGNSFPNEKYTLSISHSFKYVSFDSHQNWIKRIDTIRTWGPFARYTYSHIETRKITYY